MAPERLSRRVVRGVGWNFFGVFGTLAISFIYTLVLARIVDPDNFGRLTFLLQLLTTTILLSTMGFESAINKFAPTQRVAGDIGKTVDMIRKMVLSKLVVILSISSVLFLGSDYIATFFFGTRDLSLHIKLVAVILIPSGFEGVFRPLLISYYETKIANLSIVATRSINLVLASSLIVLLADISGGLYSELISWGLFLAFVLVGSKKKVFRERVAPISIDFRKILRFSSFLYAFTIMNMILGQQIDIILLGRFTPDAEIGFYFIGYNLSFLAVSIFNLALTGGITLAFFSELYAKRDYKGLRTTYTLLFEYNYFTIIPIAVGGLILGREIIALLYPSEYLAAVPILMLFFIGFSVMKMVGITSTFMMAMEKERILVLSRTIFALTKLGLNLLLIPTYGAMGAAVATSVTAVLIVSYESYVVHRLISPEYPTVFLGKILLASFVMGVSVFITRHFLTDSIFLLLLVGLAVYLVSVYLLKPVSRVVLEKMEETRVPLRIFWRRLFR